jgi:hypothetical protein
MIDLLSRRFVLMAAAVAAILGSCGDSRAAVMVTTFNTPMTENFNSFAGTIASIPANFTWTPDAAPGSGTNFERGFFNPAVQAYNNNNGLYALYHSPADDQSDRAFGTKKQPNTTPVILTWSFVNQTGADISSFDVSWNVEQYTQGGRPTQLDFEYDANGAGPTQAGISGTTLTTAQNGTPTTGSNLPGPPIVTARSVTISLATPLANGQPIDFRWLTFGTDPAGAHAHFAVDNVSVTAIPEPSAACLAGLGCMAGLARMFRRRRLPKH